MANYKKNLYKRDYQRLILILVLEAVVAAPVWIAAHAMPEGEGIAGEHGRRGYMMLINILLRPSLMVIGFFLSIVLISAFSKVALIILTNESITNIQDSDPAWWFTGLGLFGMLMSFVGGIVIVGGTLIIIIHKSLSLVTWLPENVIKWAGGESGSLGEQSDERRVAGLIGGVGQMQGRNGGGRPGVREPGGGAPAGGSPDGGGGSDAPSNTSSKQGSEGSNSENASSNSSSKQSSKFPTPS